MEALAHESIDPITRQQKVLRTSQIAIPTTVDEFNRLALWWDLEASRGYASAADSRRYAQNMRARARQLEPAPATSAGRSSCTHP